MENQKKRKKQLILAIMLVIGIVGITIGVTYAFFNYTRTGATNMVRVGRIYFNSSQNGKINLTNVFPIATSAVATDTNNTGTVTINIEGDTTYSEGVEYLVSAVNVNNTVNNKEIPISISVTTSGTLGTNNDNYFTARDSATSHIYKVLAGDTISNNDQLMVGYIAQNATGINGTISIKAYLDRDKISITDTLENGPIVATGYTNGTTEEWVGDRVVLTESEWNSLKSTPLSFQVKVEANEGTWVTNSNAPAVVYTAESCFTTNTYTNYVYNNNMTTEEKNVCANILTEMDKEWFVEDGFCDGTNAMIKFDLENKFDSSELQTLVENNIITNNGTAIEITDYDANTCGTEVDIPPTISNISVAKIGYGAFSSKELTSVTIPNSVTTIGEYAFSNNQLTSITIPSSVLLIDNSAFAINQLTSMTIPNGVILIGSNAFYDNLITDVVIPSSVEYIYISDSLYAFEGNPLTNVYIDMVNINSSYIFETGEENQIETFILGPHVRTIGESAFQYCNLNGNLVIPNGVTTIGDYAFSDNETLTSVTIPNSVTTIGGGAFQDTSIQSLSIDMTNIEYSFSGNEIESLTIGEHVRTIGESAFRNCNLTGNLVIPNGVTSIGDYAFSDNETLTSVTIPNSVTTIGVGAFQDTSIQSLSIDMTNIEYSFSRNEIESLTIGEHVRTIGDYAFSDNETLTSVTIPSSVTSWRCSAFDSGVTITNQSSYACIR